MRHLGVKKGCDAMEIFGTPIETIYLTTLIIAGILTLLFLFFGDMYEGVAEALPIPFLSPTLILAFLTFFSAGAYILEAILPISSLPIIFISIILSILLVILLNVFVLIMLSSAGRTKKRASMQKQTPSSIALSLWPVRKRNECV